MRQFRREFEQMRVAIMLDKTIKATQMQSLANHKKRLQRAETLFQQLIETEKKRIEEEEAEKREIPLAPRVPGSVPGSRRDRAIV